MECFVIDFIANFTCIGKECKRNCCADWQILLDDDTLKEYEKLSGLRGKYYRGHIKKSPPSIKKILLRCPFLTNDKSCVHQLTGKIELMPLVCRLYPRRTIRFNERSETTLELSCPKVVSLFFDNLGRREFVKGYEHLLSYWEIENDDEPFLDFLLEKRKIILDYIWQDLPLYVIFENLYPYVYTQNDLLAKDKLSEAQKIEISADKKEHGIHAVGGRGYAFYPIKAIDRMLLEAIDDTGVLFREPWFYRYIHRYLRQFSRLTIAEADTNFHEGIVGMIENKKILDLKYRSYFSYVIMQEYMSAFESYSLIRVFSLAILYTQILMLFDLMEYRFAGQLQRSVEEKILYTMEHNIRHNPSLTNALYSIIREELL